MNATLCEGIYDYFASNYETKPNCRPSPNKRRKHPSHNMELKRLRKAKVAAMREIRLAQQGRKLSNEIRLLKGVYLKTSRKYSKALKKSRKASDDQSSTRMKKESATSFWKFASKILDGEATSHVDPKFSKKDAKDFFTRTYSSSSHTYTQPDWLPSSTKPQQPFDCDPIRLDEVISVLKRARSSSSPCPLDGIV